MRSYHQGNFDAALELLLSGADIPDASSPPPEVAPPVPKPAPATEASTKQPSQEKTPPVEEVPEHMLCSVSVRVKES